MRSVPLRSAGLGGFRFCPAANEDILYFLFATAPPWELKRKRLFGRMGLLPETALAPHRAIGVHGLPHLAHKEEHAVDMDTGAVVAVTFQGADQGDTSTLEGTLAAAEQNLDDAKERAGEESKRTHEPEEVVADKGYHSKMVMLSL